MGKNVSSPVFRAGNARRRPRLISIEKEKPMNFTFQRNPERLLDLCGMPSIRDRRQEKLFMEKAAALDAQDLRPLVLVCLLYTSDAADEL